MNLFFNVAPFYSPEMANSLPCENETKEYFINEFIPTYTSLSKRLDIAYKIKDENLKVFYGAKGKIKNTPDTLNYSKIHNQHLMLKDYYHLLLLAAKNRHGIWLNDLLPNERSKRAKNK